MGKGARTRRGETQDLEAVGERTFVAALAAIFEVVMDRMIVGGDRLEGGEVRLGHGAARDRETLADREILEIARLSHAVQGRVKALGHCASVGILSGLSIVEQVVKHADVRALEAVSD